MCGLTDEPRVSSVSFSSECLPVSAGNRMGPKLGKSDSCDKAGPKMNNPWSLLWQELFYLLIFTDFRNCSCSFVTVPIKIRCWCFLSRYLSGPLVYLWAVAVGGGGGFGHSSVLRVVYVLMSPANGIRGGCVLVGFFRNGIICLAQQCRELVHFHRFMAAFRMKALRTALNYSWYFWSELNDC